MEKFMKEFTASKHLIEEKCVVMNKLKNDIKNIINNIDSNMSKLEFLCDEYGIKSWNKNLQLESVGYAIKYGDKIKLKKTLTMMWVLMKEINIICLKIDRYKCYISHACNSFEKEFLRLDDCYLSSSLKSDNLPKKESIENNIKPIEIKRSIFFPPVVIQKKDNLLYRHYYFRKESK